MLVFLLGLFRLVWLFGKDHRGVVMENLALRQQLSIYQRKQKGPRVLERDRWFWITLSVETGQSNLKEQADLRSACRFEL